MHERLVNDERRVLGPERRHHEHIEPAVHVGHRASLERAFERNGETGRALLQVPHVCWKRLEVPEDSHLERSAEPAHGVDQHVHALVPHQRADEAERQCVR